MYLASAALKRFHDSGQQADDLPLLRWSCDLALWRIQESLVGVLANLPNRAASGILRILIFPFGARLRPPLDELGSRLARGMLDDNEMRRRLTQDIFVPQADEEGLGRFEAALEAVAAAREAHRKTREAINAGLIEPQPLFDLPDRCAAAGIVDASEAKSMKLAAKAQEAAIQVDSYNLERYLGLKG
jgi:acyl-CoA dehydrogenase